MKCHICKKEIKKTEKFKFILIHNATHEDMRMGGFSDLDKEIISCNACCENLNFREFQK